MKRHKRSGPITHKRGWIGRAWAPRGKPFRRVAVILEELVEKHGPYKASHLEIFQLLTRLSTKNGWKGNAVTQYAWEYYLSHGYSLTEAGLLDHIDGPEVGEWLEKIHNGTPIKHSDEVIVEGKPAARIRDIPVVDTEKASWAAIAAANRAETAEHIALFAEENERTAARLDYQDIWQQISKGRFPADSVAFNNEMARRKAARKVEATNG